MFYERRIKVKKNLSIEQKKSDTDISIIAITTGTAFLIYMILSNTLMGFIKNEDIHILVRVVICSFFQFSIAGLGSVIVCIFRKETLSELGLRKEGALKSVIGAFVCFIPFLIYICISGQFHGYRPLSVLLLDDVLASSTFYKVLGLLLIGLAWGLFEGFNYAIISKKINQRYPNKKIDIGAIICAIICVLFHPFNTSLWGIVEIITTIVFIYGMVRIANKTNNAWGCIFSFLFLWNAF